MDISRKRWSDAAESALCFGRIDHVVGTSLHIGRRGLEFDSVVVLAPDEIVAGSPSGRRDLYVALTRATRRVCVFHAAAHRENLAMRRA